MITQFEGAVLLDQKQHPDAYPKEITAVVDVESLKAGICRNGQLIGQTAAEDPEGSFRMSVFGAYEDRIAAEMSAVNQAMKHYYSSGKNEDTAAIPQASVLCSQLDQVYSDTGEAMDRLCDHLLDLFDQNGIDENEVQFLRIGRLSSYYPYLYSLKKNLSGSVFLEDPRFLEHTLNQSSSEIITAASALQAEEQKFGHDVSLNFFVETGGTLQKKSYVLSERTRPVSKMSRPDYSAPFYTDTGAFTVWIDGSERKYQTRFADEMIRIGLTSDAQGSRFVCISEEHPNQPVYIPFEN